jgi:isopenicillin N synthase-like dioxygenase
MERTSCRVNGMPDRSVSDPYLIIQSAVRESDTDAALYGAGARCDGPAYGNGRAVVQYAEAERIDVASIPVIDLAGLADGGQATSAIGRQMLAAAEGIGFFYIRNHGIPASLIDAVFAVSACFFAEPLARKQQVAVNAGHRGFIQVGQAKMASRAKPDLKESFIWGVDQPGPDGIPPNRWPDFLPDMRRVLNDFLGTGGQVGWSLLRAFAAALNIVPDSFVRTIDRPISRGSILYYPPQPPDMGPDQFGVSSHTDYGCLTMLYQDSAGGLQVQGSGGTWLTAHPIEGTFVVNVGDLLARWTNDRFRSTQHRVVNRSGRARFSTGLFIDPNADTLIEPVVQPGEVAHYAPVTCAAYLRSRLDASFAYRQQTDAVRG